MRARDPDLRRGGAVLGALTVDVRILVGNEDVANGLRATQCELGVIRETLGKAVASPRAGAISKLMAERCAFFEGTQGGPQRRIEGLRLACEQRVRCPGMAHATAETNEISLTKLPEGAATIGAAKRCEHS